jgi:hypothetical protein
VYGRFALALSTVLLAWVGTVAAQTAATDPWTRVPAMPTSYYSDDGFVDRVNQAYDGVVSDIEKQRKINDELKKNFDQMDQNQKMQRMQAFMMKNPQEAMKTMQAMQAAATTTTGGVTAANNTKLLQELPGLKANFTAALDKTLKPIQARQDEMMKTRTKAISEGEIGFKTPADAAQYAALLQQENSEYEKVCASYFGTTGTFTNWLASYKEDVVKKMIVAGESNDSAIVTQLSIMDSPTGGYRSTAGLEGVRDYLGKVKDLYSLRHRKK